MIDSIKIYEEVSKFIKPVYLVGGCVRDMILKRETNDVDLATPLSPDEIENAIKGSKNEMGDNRKCYSIGKKFGSLGCTVQGVKVEITTFRSETYEKNNRKPNVEFVQDITADLSRRDFTINAIAWRDGKLIDPFGGRMHILNRKIQSVGKPSARIKEDPLRMLRCARFMSQLDYDVDEYLKSNITKLSYKMLHISKERWVMELDKILQSENPARGLELCMETGIFRFVLPELHLQKDYEQNSDYHRYDLWTHTKGVVESIENNIDLRWAALLHDIAKPFTRVEKKGKSHYYYHDFLGAEMVEHIGRRLKWSNDRRENVKELVHKHLAVGNPLRDADNSAK